MGNSNVAPCPRRLCAERIAMLTTAHPAGAAPFPWHSPCVFISIVAPEKSFESPNAVRRKNFISCMAFSIVVAAVSGMP